MPQITTDNRLLTLINVFIVEPANQTKVVNLLLTATEEVMKDLPGFVSASIHRSDDGVRVINYAQWRSNDDFSAMTRNPAAQAHMRAVNALARVEPHVCEVVETFEAAAPAQSDA